MVRKPEIKFEQPSNILLLVNKYVLLVSGIIVLVILLTGYSFLLNPKIKAIQVATEETTLTEEKEAKNKELLSKIKKLRQEYNDIKIDRQSDLNRLSAMLPSTPETAELFVLVNRLAADRDFQLVNIDIVEKIKDKEETEPVEESSLKTLNINFSLYKSVNSNEEETVYETFKLYLADLESNLRLMDIQTISFDILEEVIEEEEDVEIGEVFTFSMIMHYK